MSRRLAFLLLAALLPLQPAAGSEGSAQDSASRLPEPLREVGFDQRLGEVVPLDLEFAAEDGSAVRLGDLFGDRPVILALVYYECPMLCTLVLNGLTSGLKPLGLEAGRDFEVVAVSIDPYETPELAADKKAAQLKGYDRPGAEAGWHFLTGGREAIDALAASVGFRYSYDAESDQYAHASGVVVLTPEGRISRYLYGVEYAPRDLRLALVESAEGQIGTVVDQVLLFCFHYDPTTGRYTAVAMNSVRAAAGLTVVALALFLLASLRRERRRRSSSARA